MAMEGMTGQFRKSLISHIEENGTKIVDLVKFSGVSRDIINKLIARENSSTSAENAVRIAAYYGKTLEQFLRNDHLEVNQSLAALLEHLSPDEAEMLAAQMRGLIARRKPERQQ